MIYSIKCDKPSFKTVKFEPYIKDNYQDLIDEATHTRMEYSEFL